MRARGPRRRAVLGRRRRTASRGSCPGGHGSTAGAARRAAIFAARPPGARRERVLEPRESWRSRSVAASRCPHREPSLVRTGDEDAFAWRRRYCSVTEVPSRKLPRARSTAGGRRGARRSSRRGPPGAAGFGNSTSRRPSDFRDSIFGRARGLTGGLVRWLHRRSATDVAGTSDDEIPHEGRRHRRRHRRLLDAVPPDARGLARRDAARARRADVGHDVALGRPGHQLRHDPDDGRAEEPLDRAVPGARRRPRLPDQLPPRRRRHPPRRRRADDGRLPPLREPGPRDGRRLRDHRRGRVRATPPADHDGRSRRRALGPDGRRHRPRPALPGARETRARRGRRGSPPDAGHGAHPARRRHVDRAHRTGRHRLRRRRQRLRLPRQRGRADDGGSSTRSCRWSTSTS